jgi:hypothetical protein
MPGKPRAKKPTPAPPALTVPGLRAKRIGYDLRDPPTHDRAIAEILGALTKAQGNVVNAADALEVSHRALAEWIASEDELRTQLVEIRKRYGHTQGGGISRTQVE